MAYNPTEQDVLNGINQNGKGRPYEEMMAKAMAAYCVKSELAYKTVIGGTEDKYKGTDFRVYSDLDILTADAGILRIDFTTAFKEKDNMPVIWAPDPPIMQLDRHPLQFGIRTGNETAGFKSPVIVIGINASGNENQADDIDVELLYNKLLSNASKNAPAILSAAGSALSAYVQMANPEYAAWLRTDEAASQDLLLPEQNLLKPNIDGLKHFNTRQPTGESIRGIRVARELAFNTMLEAPSGSPAHEQAKQFASDTLHFTTIKTAPREKPGAAAQWLKNLVKAQDAMREKDSQSGPAR